MNARTSTVALLVLALAACSSDEGKQVSGEPQPASSSPSAPPPSSAPGATARPETPEAAQAPAPLRELVYPDVEGWKREEPSSPMRAAQYRLPAAEGDAKDAELVVFFFRGGAGDFDANLARWYGQFEQPDGKTSAEVARHSQTKIAGHPAREVELSGTYIAETSPGSGQRYNEPGWRMLAAHVEGADGAWFFKLVGPSKTVEHWKAEYRRFLGGVRAAE